MLFYDRNNGLFPYWIYMITVEKICSSSALKLNADTMPTVIRLSSFQNFAKKIREISRETLPDPPITRQPPRWPPQCPSKYWRYGHAKDWIYIASHTELSLGVRRGGDTLIPPSPPTLPSKTAPQRLYQEVTRRCRLSWLTKSAPRIWAQMRGRRGLRGLSQWEQMCTSRDM